MKNVLYGDKKLITRNSLIGFALFESILNIIFIRSSKESAGLVNEMRFEFTRMVCLKLFGR